MRKFRYILLLAAIFGAVSCVVDNVEYAQHKLYFGIEEKVAAIGHF